MKFPNLRKFFQLRAAVLCAGKDVFAARAPAKNGPQLREKSWGPRRRCNTDQLNMIDEVACCASVFHPTPQLASPQQRLIAGALYSPGFLSDHLSRIDRSCAVAISAPANLWFPIWRRRIICCPVEAAESHRNKTIAHLVS